MAREVGGQAAFRADQGRRAERRTHLEFLLGHEVLHAPDDLDGGPVVLPQPAVEKGGEGAVIPCLPLSEACRCQRPAGCPSVPGLMAGPLQEHGGCSASADGDLQAAILLAGGKADAERLLINEMAPEGPLPCS